jgi:hypothetical protein
LFDTGFPAPLRVHRDALAHFGLPVDRAAWLANGAVPTISAGAGGGAGEDLLAIVPQARLGPLVLERPIVQISFAQGARGHPVIVGCGALMACKRVAIDDQRQQVELELGEAVVRGDGGTWRVPAPGVILGLSIGSPATLARAWPWSFPGIAEVAAGSPAARAGLRAGDRLVAIGSRRCEGVPASQWNRSLWLQEGQSVELTVRSASGKERTVKLP